MSTIKKSFVKVIEQMGKLNYKVNEVIGITKPTYRLNYLSERHNEPPLKKIRLEKEDIESYFENFKLNEVKVALSVTPIRYQTLCQKRTVSK